MENQKIPLPEDELMGAIKIKDGLFIGDKFSAQVIPNIC